MSLASEVAFLSRELKAPVIAATFAALGDQARTEGWSHEEYLAAVLGRQVSSRTANGTRMRISAARFPALKTIEDFSFDHIPAGPRDLIAHLATTTFVAKQENVVLLGPPGTGKTHIAIALGIKAAEASYSVAFDSATDLEELTHDADPWQIHAALIAVTGHASTERPQFGRSGWPLSACGMMAAWMTF